MQYFVSYYDYYQPEAYIPGKDKYIEKDLLINEQIDKLRLSTTAALLSGRRDVIVVSSVSCIYGMGNPNDFEQSVVEARVGRRISRNAFLRELVNSLYTRSDIDPGRGQFRVKGDTVDIMLSFEEIQLRVMFWGDEIEKVQTVDPVTGGVIELRRVPNLPRQHLRDLKRTHCIGHKPDSARPWRTDRLLPPRGARARSRTAHHPRHLRHGDDQGGWHLLRH